MRKMILSPQNSLLCLFLFFGLIFLNACNKQESEELSDPELVELNYTACKQFPETKKLQDITSSMDCVRYRYAEDGVLEIKHINAGFNCCPSDIKAELIVSNDTIRIVESEIDGLCDCLCLLDVNYQFAGIPKGSYVLSVEGLYLRAEDQKLLFSVDFSDQPEGQFCVERLAYPWGI